MVASACPKCSSTDIDTDGARGEAVCTNCGHVLEECAIVSEVQFSEANGVSAVVGQFVPDEGRPYRGGPGYGGFGKDSREVTLANGKRIIQHIAGLLRLNTHHVDVAQRFFQQAVQRNFIQGRRTHTVVAVCLYIVCRKQKTAHMLIDFAEVLQTDVYELGSVFLKFCKLLHIRLDPIDPSLYIYRFASMLEFHDKTQQVASTALRIVARMNRDWMITGRRPAGICGAGLLIAAKMHHFKRTEAQIAQVVRICDSTLRKRLNEFDDTDASGMTVEKFNSLFQTGSNSDFIDSSEAKREQDRWLWTNSCAPPILKSRRKIAQQASAAESPSAASTPADDERLREEVRAAMNSEELQELDRDAQNPNSAQQFDDETPGGGACSSSASAAAGAAAAIRGGEGSSSAHAVIPPPPPPQRRAATRARPEEDEDEEEDRGEEAVEAGDGEQREGATSGAEDADGLSELDLDDEELDGYIRTEDEAKSREVVWNEMNKEYLQKQEERQRLSESRGLLGLGQEKTKKRRRVGDGLPASSAAEATQNMLRSKNLSNKVNHSALEDLFRVQDGD